MNIDEFNTYIQQIPEQIKAVVPDIVATEATEYYKDTFTKKAFDAKAWVPGQPKKKGSLLIQSGALLNSIRTEVISEKKVVIAAGNSKVSYAKIHNEGSNQTVTVPSYTRNKGKKKKKISKGSDITTVKAHSMHMNIPQRQFVGEAKELNQKIKESINLALDNIL